jgi:hypothetical protein
MPDALRCVRRAIGEHRRMFADFHLQSTVGISYEDFRKKGKATLPEDLYRSLSWEIRNYVSPEELIVTGFLPNGSPIIIKISRGQAWSCDEFAVIGTGTTIAETALYERTQNRNDPLEATVYQVYEAKRLAEKAPYVGKRFNMVILQKGVNAKLLTADGTKFCVRQFARFGPRPFKPSPLPDGSFAPLAH